MSESRMIIFSMRRRLPRLSVRWDSAAGDRGATAPERSEASLCHYDALLSSEAEISDVPVDLLKAICWYASGWRQYEPSGRVLATPAPQGVSYGCMQLNDVWHPDAFPAALTDAQASIRYASSLLRWLHEQTGDWRRATVAFFGHDRRAEVAARRVARYAEQRPWLARQELKPGVVAPVEQEPAPAEHDELVPAGDSGANYLGL